MRKSQVIRRYNWRHLVAKFLTNASGTTWWPNFLLIQVAPSGVWISNKCMWSHLLTKFAIYKVPPVMLSTHGSVVPLAMFVLKLQKYNEKWAHDIYWIWSKPSRKNRRLTGTRFQVGSHHSGALTHSQERRKHRGEEKKPLDSFIHLSHQTFKTNDPTLWLQFLICLL